ncbi:MAG TPA: glycoside hydrolase family 3 protein [Desulfobacterales bacterium]|nr:glycoside hydrolase family 3 protein [Desulfobacterales bacterium]HIP40628.1 glycoside hydrolase family 3 protein [Desulfocapsa sulfexigens]
MKLEEKIGQLFILGFKGESVDQHHPVLSDIKKRNLGGVILFDRLLAQKKNQNNIVSPAQVKALTSALQEQSTTPLLIAIDQEGGMVRRLKPEAGFPETMDVWNLGQKDDATLTSIHAACTAQTLKLLGINFNLAPVVDLNVYPQNPVIGKLKRSFSADPKCVVRHAAIWIQEHRKQNILSCIKHFPGHGSSQTDSHLDFTDISNSWNRDELIPYKKLIENNMADSVMLGHLFQKDLDKNLPTSLSSKVVENLLRGKLGFHGPVLTDDLQMKAITEMYGLGEAVCLALAAGVDMIIIGNNLEYDPEFLKRIIPVVLSAVQNNKIPENRIHTAWERIRTMKRLLSPEG